MKVSKEIVYQRRKHIMEDILSHGSINVDELAKKYEVNALTIRRDLQYWEEKGLINKYYGGASLSIDGSFNKENPNEPYKHAIAKYAASFVKNGDTIFINSSSTALLMLKYIYDKCVTVITNNARAILMDCGPNIQIVLTGGELRTPKDSLVGDFALNCISRIHANKAFLGCGGFDLKNGMSTSNMQEVLINEAMIRGCNGEVFMLADATKINRINQFIVSDANNFDYLITDSRVSDDVIYEFNHSGIITKKLEPCFNGH